MTQTIEVYQSAFSERGYGIPLWTPEPSPSEVLIGDVGFIDEGGAWTRLFNILHPADDRAVNFQGVPEGFEPLDRESSRTQIRYLPRHLHAGVYATESVKRASIKGGISA